MKKPRLHHYLLHVKSQICVGIAKIKKVKTRPLSKFMIRAMFLEIQILILGGRGRPMFSPKVESDHVFLDTSSHLYKRVCPSVCPSVRWSVCHAEFYVQK